MENLLDLLLLHVVWYAIVLLAASYIRGFSGFGFTAVFLTGLAVSLPVTEIVPLSILLELVASSGQARGIVRHVKWRELGILLATGFVCTPIGVYLLGFFHDLTLRVLAMVFIFLSSLFLVFYRRSLVSFSTGSYALAGSVIGIINGAAALSGLVLALFFSLSDERAPRIRATMIAYLFAADIWAFVVLLGMGYYDSATVMRALISLPLLAVGVWLGSRHFSSTRPSTYRKYVLWLLLSLSALGLVVIAVKELL
ncbi:MAG: sulfite exporter TauE/SafE family protein [Sulfitobacter sp.]|nr:sulfite exporter TauE/SafE family protein [Sulfitobacter sp.]